MKTATREEITEHLRDIRHQLACYRWSLQDMSDAIGVSKQTFSQYCMMPSTKGARTIPAEKIDALRATATELWLEAKERGFPSWLGRDQYLWCVFDADMALALETTSLWRAEWHAARVGGTVVPGLSNVNQNKRRLSADEELCVEWISYLNGGIVTREEAMQIADVDQHLIGLVGHEIFAWRIQPTAEQVRRIRDLHERRWRDAA